MGTVKYSGPVASFHCPTNAEIRSLKVHFSPKQEGSGDPSPENVREIVGWDGVTVQQTGKNLAVPVTPYLLPNIWADNSKVTTTGKGKIYSVYIPCKPNTTYTCSKSVESVVFVICYTKEFPQIGVPIYGRIQHNNQDLTITTGSDAKYLFLWFYNNVYGNEIHTYEEVLNTIQIEESASVTHYEPYRGRTTDYEFGVLGKNKFNPKYKNVDEYSIAGAYGYWYTEPIQLLPNTTYTIKPNSSGEIDNWYWCVAAYKNNTFNVGDDATFYYFFSNTHYGGAYVFTTGPSGVIRLATNNKTKFANVVPNVDVQLELGSTATSYEPYDPKHTVYGGWIDLISGEAVRDWILNEHTVAATDGTPGGAGTGGDTNYRFVAWNLASAHLPDSERTNLAICDIMPMSKTVGGTRFWVGGGTVYAILPNDNNEYSLTIAYAERDLNTDKYSLSPTQLQTFLGYNNVWSNADYVEVEYDLYETQDILARKQFIIANQPHIETASGDIVSFSTDVSAPLKECKIHFSPVQEGSGDPSPSNVRPISGWTGCEVTRTGKNLLGAFEIGKNVNWTTGEIETDSTNRTAIIKCRVDFNAYQYYTITGISEFSITPFAYDANNEYIGRAYAAQASTRTLSSTGFTLSQTGNTNPIAFVIIQAFSNVSGTTADINNKNIQLEFGSTATTYEPYIGTTLPIDWTTEVGTVCGGYVDLITGKLVQNYEMITINNTQAWQMKLIQNHSAAQLNLSTLTENIKKADTYGMFNYVKYMIDTSQLIDWNGRITNTGLMTIFIPSDINTREDMNNYIA